MISDYTINAPIMRLEGKHYQQRHGSCKQCVFHKQINCSTINCKHDKCWVEVDKRGLKIQK